MRGPSTLHAASSPDFDRKLGGLYLDLRLYVALCQAGSGQAGPGSGLV